MLKVKSVDHLNLSVKNLKESVDFYQKHFGFEVFEEGLGFKSNKPYKIIGISGKMMFCLYEFGDDLNPVGLNHIGINIDNFEEAIKYINDLGLDLQYGGIIEYDNSRSLYLKDPNGYEVELSEVFAGGL
jgi:catechol 2,3-dioxygenase-like lactoylglutathione lyase family enzyme